MHLAACRRSRFCTEKTLSVFRRPFVPYQAHYLPFTGEGVYPHTSGMRLFRCRHFRHAVADVGIIMRELGFDNCPASPCTQDLQSSAIHAFCRSPLY